MSTLGQPLPRIYKSHDIENDTAVWEYGRGDNNPYIEQMQLLLDAIRNDTPHNEARRGGEANLAALMGRAAAHTGSIVTWEQMTLRPRVGCSGNEMLMEVNNSTV